MQWTIAMVLKYYSSSQYKALTNDCFDIQVRFQWEQHIEECGLLSNPNLSSGTTNLSMEINRDSIRSDTSKALARYKFIDHSIIISISVGHLK